MVAHAPATRQSTPVAPTASRPYTTRVDSDSLPVTQIHRRSSHMTTAQAAAARRVTYQLETLWDYDYVPTHEELETLYETAKKNQWNATTAIDWSRPVGAEGPVLNVQMAFLGTNFFPKLTAEQQKEAEIRLSA